MDTLHHASWDSGHNKTKQTKFPLLRREEEKKEKEKQDKGGGGGRRRRMGLGQEEDWGRSRRRVGA